MAHILLVEDDDDVVRAITHILLERGYEVTHARDYNGAMACIQTLSVQLAIFSASLQDVSGSDLAYALDHIRPMLPMILLGSIFDSRYSRPGRELNMISISPPFDIEDILLRIHHRLNR